MSLTYGKLYCISVTHSQHRKTIVWPNDWLAQPIWHLLRQAPNMLHLVTNQFPIWTSFQRFYNSYFLHASSPTSHRHELQPVPVSIPPPPFHRNIHSSHFRQYSPLLWLWQIHHRHFPRSQCSIWPIDHQILLSRLNTSFGISDTTLAWLQSYLTNRTSSVRIGRHCSSSVTCTTGVPQGSVLGPLLFTAYVSPIAGIAHIHNIHIGIMPMTPNCVFLYPYQTSFPISITSLTCCIDSLHVWFYAGWLTVYPYMPDILLVPSDSPTPISSLLRLSAHHLALAASAPQPLKSGTLSLYLSVPVPVLIPSVVTSRPTTASRPSSPLNPSPLAP